MPAPLNAQQIALYMSKRRAGSRQEVAAAAAGISVSSAHRIDSGRLQPKVELPQFGGQVSGLHGGECTGSDELLFVVDWAEVANR